MDRRMLFAQQISVACTEQEHACDITYFKTLYASMRQASTADPLLRANAMPLRKTIEVIATPINVALSGSFAAKL